MRSPHRQSNTFDRFARQAELQGFTLSRAARLHDLFQLIEQRRFFVRQRLTISGNRETIRAARCMLLFGDRPFGRRVDFNLAAQLAEGNRRQ